VFTITGASGREAESRPGCDQTTEVRLHNGVSRRDSAMDDLLTALPEAAPQSPRWLSGLRLG
jgi:hypothetical protein